MKISLSKVFFLQFCALYIFTILYPRGITLTYSPSADFFTLIYKFCLYFTIAVSMIYIFIKILYQRLHLASYTFFILQYYIVSIVITLFLTGTIDSGLQSVFYPICIYLFFNEIQDRVLIIKISDIFLYCLTLLFFINTLDLMMNFTNIYHITFLGHVQVISQFGIIAFFISSYYLMIGNRNRKIALLLQILTVINCLYADVFLSKVIAIFMIIYALSFNIKRVFWKRGILISFLTFIITILILFIDIQGYLIRYLQYFDFTFNGRYQIWRIAYQKFLDSKIYGYGVFSLQFNLPWQDSGAKGINYAHNQFMQLAIDSGIVGIVSFFIMIFYMMLLTRKIRNFRVASLFLFSYFCLFIVMFIESVTYYPYYFIILILQILYERLEQVGEC